MSYSPMMKYLCQKCWYEVEIRYGFNTCPNCKTEGYMTGSYRPEQVKNRAMKALSIKQPWAWRIIRPDITDPAERVSAYASYTIKDIENRDWRADNPGLKYRGEFLIHTGLTFDGDKDDLMPGESYEKMQRGGIVGIAEIVDCVKEHHSQWFTGRYGFVLRNARPLEFRPCVGQLGFFTPNYDLKYVEKPPRAPKKEKKKLPMKADPSFDKTGTLF